MGRVLPGKVHFYDLNGDERVKEPIEITFTPKEAEKGGFEHFMMKEIHEQPKVLTDTLHAFLGENRIEFSLTE